MPDNKRLQKGILSILLPAFAFTGGPVQANPRGGVVIHGAADIANLSASQLRIHQTTRNVVINWQDFSINQGELTRFVQPKNGTALNRVVSGNISEIHGQLKGNANVYVINPNGIVIGANGVIDVGGNAVLSTLDIDDDDFLDGGTNRFYGNSTTGVTNFGTISSAGGDVVLMGGFVDNQGQIGALNGTVAIGSGGEILLQEGAGSKITVRGSSDYTGTGINNNGTIRGASAELKAHGNVYALAINNGGAIRATGADRSNGRVRLTSSGGSSNINLGGNSTIMARSGGDGGSVSVDAGSGRVNLGGVVDAGGAETGGEVSVVGNEVVQAAGSSVVASGGSRGGSVKVDAADTMSLSGSVRSEGAYGAGGQVDLTAKSILIHDSAVVSANGDSLGGSVRIGGDFQGRDTGLREADSVRVEEGAKLSADASSGDAGRVIVWANGDTIFLGDVSAKAKGAVGNGGLVEVSGKQNLYFDGTVGVNAVNGKSGTVLFDPGDVVIGSAGGLAPPLGSPVLDSLINISAINDTLQSGANVLVVTDSGSIEIQDLGGGGTNISDASGSNRHAAIQWTNSLSSFGAFASGSIIVNNHIRTSGGGSVNLLAGWSGGESDPALALDPQSAWDFYVSQGAFGANGGSVIIGNSAMARHVEVGSRYGDTNVAGFDVRVIGANTNSVLRYSMIGFHDGGQVFGPRLNKGGNFRLDMKVGAASGNGAWLLSDGLNGAGQAAAGAGDPIVGVAGQNEVDVNGDGIMDGVRGINSTGVVTESFIPYANHYNSALTGNWWWQQIEDAGQQNLNNPGLNLTIAGTVQTADPLGLGGRRPEYGAGSETDGANINVIAKGSVTLLSGTGNEETSASIGHGGPNRSNWGGGGTSIRDIGSEDVTSAAFSIRTGTDVNQLIEQGQMERRWTFNGSTADRNATAIGRLAAVYGNINVLAGVDGGHPIQINRADGTVTAQFGTVGDVILRANQSFKTSSPASNSPAHIGHGGVGQFGEFYGNITVEAAGSVTLEAGEATRSAAVIGHSSFGHAYWNAPNNVDQQIRFFATTGDFDNPNLRRGELFSGNVTTGFDPASDPAAGLRYTLGNGYAYDNAGTWTFVGHNDGGNFVAVATDSTGTSFTGQYVNFNNIGGNEARRVIPMNPLLYTRGTSFDGSGANPENLHTLTASSQGRNSLAPLTLSPLGSITVEALDGSTIKGFHGDIKVRAYNGNITLKAFSTDSSITGNFPRDSRFAAIGHGGAEFGFGSEGSGFKNLIGTPVVPGLTAGAVTNRVDGREIVNYRITGSNGIGSVTTQSGSESYINGVGSGLARYGTNFMTITGDIDVEASGDVTLVGGNDVWDFTRIGHGGKELADYETSSFVLGDIRVHAGGNVNVIGGGEMTNFVRAGNVSMSAWAQIGHGGVNSGFMGYFGDIEVNAGGDVLVRNGAYRRSFGKIGHQGMDDWGQSGGDYSRNEHFWADGIESTTTVVLNNSTASVTYASANGGVNGFRDFTAGGAGDLVGAERRTANISVTAGGSVTLDHLQEGLRQPPGRNGGVGDVENQSLGLLTRDSYSQIGHGGINADILNANNFATNFGTKVGDIFVTANGGSLILENGTGQQRWTRIGHGVGQSDRVDDGIDVNFSRALELVGDIRVQASGDIRIDADAADENERAENTNALFGAPAPSRINPVAIGHGGPYDNLDLVVLSNGEDVKGIAASSDITAVAGGNLWILGGKGVESSYAQLGHGFSSDQGNDRSYRRGLPTGFSGDIDVSVNGSITVKAGDNAWSEQPSGISDDQGRSVLGAFAAIGHGGYQVDAPSSGDIRVYARNDLSVIAQNRTDPFTNTGGSSPYNIVNPDTDSISSGFSFAKIGHFSAENGNRLTNFADDVREANQLGDITVVVGRDVRVAGGTTPDVDLQTIYGSFAQIGHGGPSIVGNLEGDVTVLAGRDLTVAQGSEISASSATTQSLNNYAMIGNGDYLYDTGSNPLSIFNDAAGFRKGDIVLAAGRHIGFNGALVGHADPEVATNQQLSEGNTLIAVSRNNPFFGGRGLLTAVNETVITSGGFGVGSQAMFFMPARSNNRMDDTTRINEVSSTFLEAPANFAAPFNKSNGILAGRADEVYLTPDLWWDQAGLAAAGGYPGGGVFPTDAASGQGGALASVDSPGGLFNLAGVSPGNLGDSAPLYRDGNGVSGAGHYTLYYDAIEAVVNELPAQPTDPSIPLPLDIFDFFGLPFTETFDAFFREEDLFSDGVGGYGNELYPLLALFERDEETVEDSGAWRLENSLDNLFGERRDSGSEEERDEEEESRIARGSAGGPVGMTFYIFEPGTNRYSSYRVFGNQITSFYPVN